MKTIELKCANCGHTVIKPLKEYTRRKKQGNTDFFCGRSCATSKSNKDNPRPGNITTLHASNRKDKFTPFRWFVLRAQNRNKRKHYGCDLTVEYLKELWEHQNGICPFTGWQMILPENTNGWISNNLANASIDRLNNSKGYTQDNVRFICLIANYARNAFTDDELIKFCRAVTNND